MALPASTHHHGADQSLSHQVNPLTKDAPHDRQPDQGFLLTSRKLVQEGLARLGDQVGRIVRGAAVHTDRHRSAQGVERRCGSDAAPEPMAAEARASFGDRAFPGLGVFTHPDAERTAEQIDAVRGQIEEVKGQAAFFETQLSSTIIRAPVTGTILERAVEKGEFVTTGFVGALAAFCFPFVAATGVTGAVAAALAQAGVSAVIMTRVPHILKASA